MELLTHQKWTEQSTGSYRQALRFSVFDTGYIKLPPLLLIVGQGASADSLYSNDIAVEIFGITLDSTGLAPIKAIVREPMNFRDFIPVLVVLVAGLALLALLFLRKRKSVEQVVVIKVKEPAHEIALRDLNELKEKKLWQQGKIKAYQSELTHIIRAYLEDRFDIPALESTTGDIVAALDQNTSLEQEPKAAVEEVLNMADLIKFAKAIPNVEVHDLFMKKAESFVRTTKVIKPIILDEEE